MFLHLLYYEYHKLNFLALNHTLQENFLNKHVKNKTILNAENINFFGLNLKHVAKFTFKFNII